MKKFKVCCIALILILMAGACGKSIAAQVAEQLELGQQYLLEEEYEQAVVAFNKAIELEPNTKEAYYGLGQSYEGLAGKAGEDAKEEQNSYYAQAEEAYLQVLQMDTMDSDACTRLIVIYENMGELEKLAALGTYYYGETVDEGLLQQIEEARTCLDVIQQISDLCEAGNMDEVFALLQSEDYQKLKELSARLHSPAFLIKDGVGIGLYMVSTERYGMSQFGDCMVYYGAFADGMRQGHGLWFGYDNGNNYYASGEWSDDRPNGEQEVREWYSLLDEGVATRVIKGNVVNGLWNGPVQWIFEEKDGSVETFPVSFTNGKWDILEVTEGENGPEYRVSESISEEKGSMYTYHPDEPEGIVGFLSDYGSKAEEIPEPLPEENDAEDAAAEEETEENTEYTLEELEQLVADYRERHGLYKTQYVYADYIDGDMVSIQCYDVIMDEESGDSHTATSDWYTVNKYTAAGHDLDENEIDLKN